MTISVNPNLPLLSTLLALCRWRAFGGALQRAAQAKYGGSPTGANHDSPQWLHRTGLGNHAAREADKVHEKLGKPLDKAAEAAEAAAAGGK